MVISFFLLEGFPYKYFMWSDYSIFGIRPELVLQTFSKVFKKLFLMNLQSYIHIISYNLYIFNVESAPVTK